MTVIVVTMPVTMTMMSGCERLLSVVPGHIREDAILDVASEETLFAEGRGILLGVDSPSHLSAEEEGTVVVVADLLVKVVLEQFLGLA